MKDGDKTNITYNIKQFTRPLARDNYSPNMTAWRFCDNCSLIPLGGVIGGKIYWNIYAFDRQFENGGKN